MLKYRRWFSFKPLIIIAILTLKAVNGFTEFQMHSTVLSKETKDYLNRIDTAEWIKFVELGTDSVLQEKRLEENLLQARVTIENGSISHVQLLDAMPNAKAQQDSEVAMKILRSSLYVYNSVCTQYGISGIECAEYLTGKQLPQNSTLFKECVNILYSRRDGHHAFRRLLPRNYKDGFYRMNSNEDIPSPLAISEALYEASTKTLKKELFDENGKNIAIVQWTQFIEHDISKPVVMSMINGDAIECCDKENFKLSPRFHHPGCAPLLRVDTTNKYGWETCLSYVRSALAVGSKCTFGAAEQLNQATAYFDLSQLYGYTEYTKKRMRSFKNGYIKSTSAPHLHQEFLPIANNTHTFCARRVHDTKNSFCFMAGDSRANSNPFIVVVYTIFLRNHNQIAKKLQIKHSDWSDERLFQIAKAINIAIYRRIIFNEWLPIVLGKSKSDEINKKPLTRDSFKVDENINRISNEFSVAAIRFYYSMMPNMLYNFSNFHDLKSKEEIGNMTNDVLPEDNVFVLKDHMYTSDINYTASIMNNILESLLHQLAMKLDNRYVESLMSGQMPNMRPIRPDILALDIQRGRDHGIQAYVKYAEICNGLEIRSWKDLKGLFSTKILNNLKAMYSNWSEIDLIVGGISENRMNDSTIGPTFACIFAEQLSKIRQWQYQQESNDPTSMEESTELDKFSHLTAADVLCANSDLKYVPQNIFKLPSLQNLLMKCKNGLEAFD